MSANTKIVVLRRKELLYTGIFIALGVLFLILLLMLLLPEKDTDTSSGTTDAPDSTAETAMPDNVADTSLETASAGAANVYIPGIYTTELVLGSEIATVEVIVSDHAITSLRLADSDDTLTTMYPLLAPAMDSLSEQICETQDLSQVTYSSETRYTSLVLLEAIKTSLEKAKPGASPEASTTPTASPESSSTTSSEADGKTVEPKQVPTADINPAA